MKRGPGQAQRTLVGTLLADLIVEYPVCPDSDDYSRVAAHDSRTDMMSTSSGLKIMGSLMPRARVLRSLLNRLQIS